MDANNYVQDNGDGTFEVVVNGSTIYSNVDQNYAENAFNRLMAEQATNNNNISPQDWIARGGSAYGTTTYASGNPSGGYSGGGDSSAPAGNTNISDVFRARTESNQIDLNEKMREWDQAHALDKQRFGLSQQQFEEQRRQYGLSLMTNFAQSLLNGATQLRGPSDWMQYAQYTGGGRDIFNQLTGGATPAFGAPTGYSKPAGITDILKQIGMPNLGDLMNQGNLVSGRDYTGYAVMPWYDQFQAKNRRPPTQQEWVQGWTSITGLSPDIGMKLWQMGKDWQAQTGQIAPQDVQQRWVEQMANGGSPQSGVPNSGTINVGSPTGNSGNQDADLDAIWAGRPDLAQHYQQNGWDVSTPEKQRAAVRNWLTYPGNAGKTPAQVRQELGLGASAPVAPQPGAPTPTSQPEQMQNWITPVMEPGQPEQPQNWISPVMEPNPTEPAAALIRGATGTNQPTRGNIDPNVWNALTPDAQALYNSQGYLVNDPHQVNIANWNAMSPTAQQETLGAVEGGLTKSGAWNRDDWLRQMYNAAPKGQAPRRVQTNWGSLGSGY